MHHPCAASHPLLCGAGGHDRGVAGVHFGLASASAAVILVSDVFGNGTPLLRKLADKVGVAGYFALVPGVLQGEPYVRDWEPGEYPKWIARHPGIREPVTQTRRLVEVVKEQGIASVGVVGFCYVAKVAVAVGKETEVRAVVQLHPSFADASDYEQVRVPISVLAAPTDGIEKYERILASRTDLESIVKIFPNVKHGWTVRYEETYEDALEKANEAHKLMLDWFANYL